MKKICVLLASLLIIGNVNVSAADAAVTDTYTQKFSTVQGADNWYYCAFAGDEVKELVWVPGASKYLTAPDGEFPYVDSVQMNTATNAGVGYRFAAPEKGMVRLVGKFYMDHPQSSKSNGVNAHVGKGGTDLWTGLVKANNEQEFEVITSVKAGENLYFYADANGNNSFDWFHINATVEYLDMQYVSSAEGSKYYEKIDGTLNELAYDEDADRYNASDGIGFISGDMFSASSNCTLVKRYAAEETTRYRVSGTITPLDVRSGGTVVTVRKNGETVWQQLVTENIPADIDVRMRAKKGDNIDIELDTAEYAGFNCSRWDVRVKPFPTLADSAASTSQNFSYSVLKEIKLSSIAGKTNQDGVKFYSQRFSRKIPMVYDSGQQKWVSAVEGDPGYIGAKAVHPGSHYDSVMEYTVKEDGILRVDGNLKPAGGDGVVSKIFLNDKAVWSSRVGEEGPVKWDEPYDVSYFSYGIGAVMRVKAGDVVKFTFNQWRLANDDMVDISGVTLKYISGDVLSETTKWKIANSILIDTADKTVHKNGKTFAADITESDGTTYILKSDALNIFGNGISAQPVMMNGKEYLPIRKTAEENGKRVTWGLERFVILHDSIQGFFGWQELSEMDTALKGDALFD